MKIVCRYLPFSLKGNANRFSFMFVDHVQFIFVNFMIFYLILLAHKHTFLVGWG